MQTSLLISDQQVKCGANIAIIGSFQTEEENSAPYLIEEYHSSK